MSFLYVMENGASLSVDGGYIVIRYAKSEMIKKIPIKTLESIALFGNISFTTPCLKTCLVQGIPVTFYASNGAYFGRLVSTRHQNIGRVKKQLILTERESFAIPLAMRILSAKIHNQQVILRRYARHNNADINEEIRKMSVIQRSMEKGKTISEITGYEGIAAKTYFAALKKLVNKDFVFDGRNRQPPLDPFNSMLSLGYTLLMYEIYGMLEANSLNAYAAFIHSDKLKHPTLASDLMEEWRAVIVDSVVLSLIQGHEISIEHFFKDEETGGVYLTQEGMKLFITKMEKKFRSETGYIGSTYRMSYRRVLHHQVNQLTAAIEGENADIYEPIRIK